MKFLVYYIDSADYAKTIHAKDSKDAAIKFLQNIPRTYDCQIYVEAKEFRNRDEDGIFNTLNLLSEVAKSKRKPIRAILDKNILHGFDVVLFEEFIERHPEWLEYAKPNKEENYIVEIHIPCPIKGNPSIDIYLEGNETSPVVGFGPIWYDSYCLKSISGVSWQEWWDNENLFADAVDEFVENITSEQLIASAWKAGFKSHKSGLIDPETYSNLMKNNKIISSCSWQGNYNFNYDGEWTNSYSNQV